MSSGYAGKQVLVAGGAGFVGAHLVRALLKAGAQVQVIDNFHTGRRSALPSHPALAVMEHDISQPLPALPAAPQVIFNLACPASPIHYQKTPLETWRSSVYGTDNLLMLAHRSGARFVMASTSEVYGDPEVSPQAETYLGNVSPTGPRACYDEGKRAAEALIMDFHRVHGLDTRIARLFNTYGPGMQTGDGRVVPAFITQALAGESLTVAGDGSQTRSFCYVSDTVRGLLALGEKTGIDGCVVNIGSQEERSILELARIISKMAGRALRVTTLPAPPDDPRQRRPDIRRAAALIGWKPEIALVDGLALTFEDFSTRHQ